MSNHTNRSHIPTPPPKQKPDIPEAKKNNQKQGRKTHPTHYKTGTPKQQHLTQKTLTGIPRPLVK
jgi:hypothetical protein